MLRIVGSDGSLFEMDVVGYQFPTLQMEQYDSNWLLIRVHVVHPRGQWISTDPCLLTYELASLADWLDAVARGQPIATEQSFIEPNLSFRLMGWEPAGRRLRVYFELESRPRWAASETAPGEDLYIEFPYPEVDWAGGAEELRRQLAQFPQRAER